MFSNIASVNSLDRFKLLPIIQKIRKSGTFTINLRNMVLSTAENTIICFCSIICVVIMFRSKL